MSREVSFVFAFRDGKDWPVPINQTTVGVGAPKYRKKYAEIREKSEYF